MARVLVIEDDGALVEVLALAFGDAGHEVKTAIDGTTGIDTIRSWSPDAVVCDVNMPGIDGFSLCKRLRDAGNTVPLVLLTSRDNEIDESLGLELGADDYVAKPFSTRILLARVAALLRRDALRRKNAEPEKTVVAGALALDTERLEARFHDTLLTLTLTEFRMLEAFARRPGIVLSRARLLDIVRGDDSVVAERIVDTYVRRLRRKLEEVESTADPIETVVGAGYRYKTH
ncbi:Phosphate regulon transcriptional regulatory protein PhoB (SphR) [Labilithrix luteola]|uniref:Phosphate regulon transcriptional regulatory protein PhoB (SphR) n=1 Tax=Labilithrix luteola TaxID=1391654 RepID=A0A0K1Q1K9_9BACT|nr:response regulator transcription factor [Labilithrix luteola]AKU99622.1 Phosphate regulon transcriptional regulatory protein PhoB (SphR) [Labilithrix luteola]